MIIYYYIYIYIYKYIYIYIYLKKKISIKIKYTLRLTKALTEMKRETEQTMKLEWPYKIGSECELNSCPDSLVGLSV